MGLRLSRLRAACLRRRFRLAADGELLSGLDVVAFYAVPVAELVDGHAESFGNSAEAVAFLNRVGRGFGFRLFAAFFRRFSGHFEFLSDLDIVVLQAVKFANLLQSHAVAFGNSAETVAFLHGVGRSFDFRLRFRLRHSARSRSIDGDAHTGVNVISFDAVPFAELSNCHAETFGNRRERVAALNGVVFMLFVGGRRCGRGCRLALLCRIRHLKRFTDFSGVATQAVPALELADGDAIATSNASKGFAATHFVIFHSDGFLRLRLNNFSLIGSRFVDFRRRVVGLSGRC